MVCAGTYNNSTVRLQCSKENVCTSEKSDVRCVLYTITLIVYMYLMCMILAVAAELSHTNIPQNYKGVNFI